MVDIVERLGQEGLHLQKLAGGEINRPLLTDEPAKDFIASFEFDDPVETLESIFFILNRLLQQLCTNLAAEVPKSPLSQLPHSEVASSPRRNLQGPRPFPQTKGGFFLAVTKKGPTVPSSRSLKKKKGRG